MTTPTPYERLLAEELPTGEFGGPRPDTPRQLALPQRTPREDAARHYAELAAALGERPLRPVPEAPAEAADQAA